MKASPHEVNANSRSQPRLNSANKANLLFFPLLSAYTGARVFEVYPGSIPMEAVVALHVFLPLIFAITHGIRIYRVGGILWFLVITLLVANFSENLSLRTGIPFGHYYFTDLMGPKLGKVPVMLGLAYVGMAYLSWTLARISLRALHLPLHGRQVITVPLLASCILLSWDLSQEPIWSTVLHAWIWLQAGKYFGVPVNNFCGWFLTVYFIYQLFAIYLLKTNAATPRFPVNYWWQVVVFYGVSAAGNLLLLLPQSRLSTVTDPAGREWRVSTIVEACALITLCTMGLFTVLAGVRLRQDSQCQGIYQPNDSLINSW